MHGILHFYNLHIVWYISSFFLYFLNQIDCEYKYQTTVIQSNFKLGILSLLTTKSSLALYC